MESFTDYKNLFVQPIPRYAVKSGHGWRSRNKPISDPVVKAHLDQQYTVGSLSRWYPAHAVFDLDSVPHTFVDDIRGQLSLDDSNSMLCTSESPDSYHLLFRPTYKDKPPTISLLQSVIKPFAKNHGIEIYPQKNRVIRLPFGKYQDAVDFKYSQLDRWQDRLYWFCKLDEYDLAGVKYHQLFLDFPKRKAPAVEPRSVFQQGAELLKHGLQNSSTRHESQFKVIYYLWRRNVARDEAIRTVWQWIRKKHNGFSKDIIRHPQRVKYEIDHQVAKVYTDYELAFVYPDTTHNTHYGYIAKPDLFEIVEAVKGSLPRSRFLFQLLRYAYPRRYRSFINIHRDRLVNWSSSRTYLKYINELDEKKIVRRGKAYYEGKFSKAVKFNWQFKDSNQAILYEGRSVNTFDESVRLIHKAQDYSDKLKSVGVERTTARKSTIIVFGSTG